MHADPRKPVLLIGLEPGAVDFSDFPGMNERVLVAGLQSALDAVNGAGFDAQWCLVDAVWDTARDKIAAALAAHAPVAVMIGAGVRTAPAHFLLFERIVNLVHEAAPGARLCFNSSPPSTLEAVLRWVSPS